jgi:alpha/beta hydrolase fold
VWDYYAVIAARRPDQIVSLNAMPHTHWFTGAQLNYAQNVLAAAPRIRPALIEITEDEAPREWSTAELAGKVGALSRHLRSLGVMPGDRVAAYLPNSAEAVIALGSAEIYTVVDQFDEIRPGCGQSPAPLLPMRMPQIAALITDVMDSLGLQRADILGCSLGGVVALALAHRFPDRIRRLVLASTTPGAPGAPTHPAIVAMLLSPIRYYNRRVAELIVPLIAGGQTARDRRALRAGLQQRLMLPPSLRGYTYQLLAISTFTAWPWLHRIPHRTLVVHGRDDPGPSLNSSSRARPR